MSNCVSERCKKSTVFYSETKSDEDFNKNSSKGLSSFNSNIYLSSINIYQP